MRLLIFGYGFSGRQFARRMAANGWRVAATYRSPEARGRIETDGFEAISIDDPVRLAGAIQTTTALLITPPPVTDGCPGLAALTPELRKASSTLKWIGYLSTTGVYGDRQGRWVNEQSGLAPVSAEGTRRVNAERQWLTLGEESGLTVTVVRLPGIYGPGRSAFDRLREGRARRITAPGQVFSRIHVIDLAAGLEASIHNPRAGRVYNFCDDEPAPNSDVIAYAAGLLDVEPPQEVRLEDAQLSTTALRFYLESKRVSNAFAKAELGWRPVFPTYREGLASILAAGG